MVDCHSSKISLKFTYSVACSDLSSSLQGEMRDWDSFQKTVMDIRKRGAAKIRDSTRYFLLAFRNVFIILLRRKRSGGFEPHPTRFEFLSRVQKSAQAD